jgi:hypothetical protein
MKRLLATAFLCTNICFAQHHHNIQPVPQHHSAHDPAIEHPEFPIELSLAGAWESHYVSEGRDNLDDDSLASVEATAGYEGITVGAWAAESPDQDYREYNYWLEYNYEWQAFTFTAAYTYLDFHTDDADDKEISFYIGYAMPYTLQLEIGGYYSDENSGTFYEATLSAEIEFTDEWALTPFANLGYNDDYIAEGHNGLNHLTLGLELNYAINQQISIGAYVAHNIAIDSESKKYADDDLLDDFTYYGISASLSF